MNQQTSCRICTATEYEEVQNIFDAVDGDRRLIDMLEYCLQQTIDTSDCFPKTICSECIAALTTTYEFFQLYKKSEVHFIRMHQNVASPNPNGIKVEEILIKTEQEMIDDVKAFGEPTLACFGSVTKLEATDHNENDRKLICWLWIALESK